jgi:hypothetical protein
LDVLVEGVCGECVYAVTGFETVALVRLLSVVRAMSGACCAAGNEIRAFLTPSISRFAAK